MDKVMLHLWNGSKTKKAWNSESPEWVDGQKPEERWIPCDFVTVTFMDQLKVTVNEQPERVALYYEQDYVVYDGCFFGDWTVYPLTPELLAKALRDRGLDGSDLAADVIEATDRLADGVNNEGLESQVKFLLENGLTVEDVLDLCPGKAGGS